MNDTAKDALDYWPGETTIESLKRSFNFHLKYSLAKDKYSATKADLYQSISLAVRDRLVEKWIKTQQSYYKNDVKRVYYLSMEFLIGRLLTNSLINMDFEEECRKALFDLGYDLEELGDIEAEAGLGNGGLGRLAACFLDSLATLNIPAYGYGIRYEFGIFFQKIINGCQVETSDHWLRRTNPWEIARPEFLYPVRFYGRVQPRKTAQGVTAYDWINTHDDVIAMAYDIAVPGYKNETVNNLRLWAAKSTRELDLDFFNQGDYVQAVQNKQSTENISKVLYPNDNIFQGKKLRLKQEYFFVSASLQDILRRFKKNHDSFERFSDKVAIQLNDTHPALAIPELMRIFIDEEHIPWEKAWDITVKTFGYTNHTVLPEALEKWPVDLMEKILPRHLQVVYEINRRFLDQVSIRFPEDNDRLSRLSIIEESPIKSVRMANLCVAGSHSINGVAALHTEILKDTLFRDHYEMLPERFNNKTNGITQRRWLKACNPELAELISEHIGEKWVVNLDELKKLIPLAENPEFRERWRWIKKNNKKRLAAYVQKELNVRLDINTLFDTQVKRIHEYKRQLLNVLYAITLYSRIRKHPENVQTPRTLIFSGKAAPGYAMAKLIIRLINCVAAKVNTDRTVGNKLKVVFIPNYSVSVAEKIIPAADLSQQISTAGTEASGTGNMKLSLNGALTIGTLDGANVEIMNEVGEENIYIFGLKTEEVLKMRQNGYQPQSFYQANDELRETLDMVAEGCFSPDQPDLFRPITDSLLAHGDWYLVLADFASYCQCQESVSREYLDTELWTRKSILNTANMGKFSSDRTILEYAREIWGIHPAPR